MKCTPVTYPQYAMIKTNLSTYRNILRTTIRLAKQTYHQNLFNKYKNNIKQTWNTLLNKFKTENDLTDHFIINDVKVDDKI